MNWRSEWTSEGYVPTTRDSRRLSTIDSDDRTGEVPIVSISSGKGGVGKTVLAANLARLLSWSGNRVLLVDLDLYSRGASALIADTISKDKTTVVDLLELADNHRMSEIPHVVKHANLVDTPGTLSTLFLLPCTHSSEVALGPEYQHDVLRLRDLFRQLVAEFISLYDLKCVIFDCRPGPEPLFLAAAGVSSDVILITEPDMVTWDSNMNLFNCLYNFYKRDAKVLLGVQFVINRIPDSYDVNELVQLYQRRVSRFLKGRRILAAIPFDGEVFNAFTRETFFVDTLPSSRFVTRVAHIAEELFSLTHPELLSGKAKLLEVSPRESRVRSFLTRRPAWANLFIVLGTLYALAGLLLVLPSRSGNGGLAGLFAVLTGAVAFLFVALYSTRSGK